MRLPVAPTSVKADLLVMAIARRVGDAVDIGQRLRVAEVARLAQGQIERGLGIGIPALWYGEGRVQHEIGEAAAPVGGRLDRGPRRPVHIAADGRRRHGVRQRLVEKGWQRRLLAIDQLRLLDQAEAAGDFVCGPIGLVIHEFLLANSSINVDGRLVCES
ncbi:MAG: hypothetical protein V9G19_11290 [Tetrasphaera sp.]